MVAVLSVNVLTFVAVVDVVALPANVVAVIVLVHGLHDIPELFRGFSYDVIELSTYSRY